MSKSNNFWKKMISNYEQSNLKKAEFCKQNRLVVSQFYYWCSKLRPDLNIPNNSIRNTSENSLFLPVKKDRNEKGFQIILNDTKLSFDSLPEPSWLASLLKSMGESNVIH